MNKFTGVKDTDFLILMQLSDTDLNAVCRVNRYAKKLCDDDVFWRNRLFKKKEIFDLEKEFKNAEYPDEYFMNLIHSIKQFLEFSSWKEFYIFLFLFPKNVNDISKNIRECILRFDQNETKEKLFEYIRNIEYPDWINPDNFQKTLKREYFLGFGRADGEQGRLRLDKIKDDFDKIISKIK